MKTDYRTYPPRIATVVEVAERRDGGRPAYIIGPGAAGRYILLHEAEYKVFGLLTGSLQPGAVCDEFKAQYGGELLPVTLTRFLTRLDQVGILAGECSQGNAAPDQLPGQQFYVRFTVFNPERLFARLVLPLRWIWTVEFVAGTLLLMLFTVLLALVHWAEVTSYSDYILREHYVAVLAAGLIVVVSHEFAHGLTCRAFGGRVTEVGVLLVFYFLPALYCNVSPSTLSLVAAGVCG
jgi:putative peptide zinc metalloprotease protein